MGAATGEIRAKHGPPVPTWSSCPRSSGVPARWVVLPSARTSSSTSEIQPCSSPAAGDSSEAWASYAGQGVPGRPAPAGEFGVDRRQHHGRESCDGRQRLPTVGPKAPVMGAEDVRLPVAVQDGAWRYRSSLQGWRCAHRLRWAVDFPTVSMFGLKTWSTALTCRYASLLAGVPVAGDNSRFCELAGDGSVLRSWAWHPKSVDPPSSLGRIHAAWSVLEDVSL